MGSIQPDPSVLHQRNPTILIFSIFLAPELQAVVWMTFFTTPVRMNTPVPVPHIHPPQPTISPLFPCSLRSFFSTKQIHLHHSRTSTNTGNIHLGNQIPSGSSSRLKCSSSKGKNRFLSSSVFFRLQKKITNPSGVLSGQYWC